MCIPSSAQSSALSPVLSFGLSSILSPVLSLVLSFGLSSILFPVLCLFSEGSEDAVSRRLKGQFTESVGVSKFRNGRFG